MSEFQYGPYENNPKYNLTRTNNSISEITVSKYDEDIHRLENEVSFNKMENDKALSEMKDKFDQSIQQNSVNIFELGKSFDRNLDNMDEVINIIKLMSSRIDELEKSIKITTIIALTAIIFTIIEAFL